MRKSTLIVTVVIALFFITSWIFSSSGSTAAPGLTSIQEGFDAIQVLRELLKVEDVAAPGIDNPWSPQASAQFPRDLQ